MISVQRVDLHCHLDGSVRLATIEDLARSQGRVLARPASELAVAPADVGSLRGFLPYIDVALDVLQTAAALERAAQELVEDWASDGVIHGEARFAPQLHTRGDLNLDDAIRAVSRGLAAGARSTGVNTALIVCCLRHQDPETSLAVADAAVRLSDIVHGVDLAGDEGRPGAPHREAFDLARAGGVRVTVHAGEAAGPSSVWEAIDVLGAERIGHGVRSVGDIALTRRLAKDAITLEACPRCNVLTGAVPDMPRHPIIRLLDDGVRVTVSTDARTTAATTLRAEHEQLRQELGWSTDHERLVLRYALDAAFRTPPSARR